MTLLPLFGCNHHEKGWPSTTIEVDSICTFLDKYYLNDEPIPDRSQAILRLDSLSAAHPDKEIIKAISLYWKSALNPDASPDSVNQWVNDALALVDSTRYPYLKDRLDLLFTTSAVEKNFRKYHERLIQISKDYEHRNDTKMQLLAIRRLGTFYLQIGEMYSYRSCMRRIEEILSTVGNDTLAERARLNSAVAEILTGEKDEARRILHSLLETDIAKRDSIFLSRIYINLGQLDSDPEAYGKALEYNPFFRNVDEYHQTIMTAMMKGYEERGLKSDADSLLSILRPSLSVTPDPTARLWMHKVLMRQARDAHQYERMADEADSIVAISPLTVPSNAHRALVSDMYTGEIDRYEQQREETKKIHMFRLIIVCFFAFLIITVGWTIFKLRHDKIKLQQAIDRMAMAEMERELAQDKARLASVAMSINERDRLIDEISGLTDKLADNGSLDYAARQTILNEIKSSQIDINQWDDFHTAYSKVHPLFLKRLKMKYPDITEGDAVLALYIAAGLSSKQIAATMHLQLDSVKKNRQRLRKRMMLQPSEELESVLRSLL